MHHPTTPEFNYGGLPAEVRTEVQATTQRLRELERIMGEAIIEMGRGLIAVKERLGHGHFGTWLHAEFRWSADTANRFMNVAKRFGENPHIAESATHTALYLLASNKVPEEIRVEFVERAEQGERITTSVVNARVAEHWREQEQSYYADLEPRDPDFVLAVPPSQTSDVNDAVPPVEERGRRREYPASTPAVVTFNKYQGDAERTARSLVRAIREEYGDMFLMWMDKEIQEVQRKMMF